ncbi:MAG: hypothetical protein ACE5D3_04615 [Candidatus Binatia bacterium]
MTDSAKKPAWLKRAVLIIGTVGPLAGAVATVATEIIDVRDHARKASTEAEAGYETLAPAVDEIQTILANGKDWSEYANDAIDSLEQRVFEQERRIIRLEAYIDILSKQRNMPDPPDIDDRSFAKASSATVDAQRPKPALPPKRPVPRDISKAKTYQQQRTKLRCTADDPLCGLAE